MGLLDSLRKEEEQVIMLSGFPPALETRGVTAGYGGVQVLFGVDMYVQRGEVVALLGANGAGKTTLLRVLSGLEPAWEGEVILNGSPLGHKPAFRRVSDGICQIVGGASIADGLTVGEHLRLWGASVKGGASEAALAEVDEVFPRLAERRSQVASTLSGGEKQMLALAKALIVQPPLLVIDEFSIGLAPIVVGELLPVIRRINQRGSAVLMVEQSVNVALSVAHRAYCMEKGRLVYEGAAEQLRAQPDLLRSVYLEGVTAALNTTPDAHGVPAGAGAAPAHNQPDHAAAQQGYVDPHQGHIDPQHGYPPQGQVAPQQGQVHPQQGHPGHQGFVDPGQVPIDPQQQGFANPQQQAGHQTGHNGQHPHGQQYQGQHYQGQQDHGQEGQHGRGDQGGWS